MGILNYLVFSVTWLSWIIVALKTKNQKNGFNKYLRTTAFLLPFYAISFILFGFEISFLKINSLFILFLYVLQNKFKFSNEIKKFFIYLIGITIISYLISLATDNFTNVIENYDRPILNAYINPLVQSIFFLTSISQIWLIDKKSIFNSISILKSYIFGSYFLIVFGYLQFYLVKMKIFIFKYKFIGPGYSYTTDEIIESVITRMNSLAGEPKYYAVIVAFTILAQIYLRSKNLKIKYITDNVGNLFIILAFGGILLSFSANVITIFLLTLLFYFYMNNKKSLIYNLLVILVFALVFYIMFSDAETISQNFLLREPGSGPAYLFKELITKMSSIEMIKYALPRDVFGIRAIFDNFFSFFFGNGIGMIDLYHMKYWIFQENIVQGIRDLSGDYIDNIVQPSINILRLFGNGGLIGVYLILVAFNKKIKIINDYKTKNFIYAFSLFILLTGSVSLTLGTFLLAIIIKGEIDAKKSFNTQIK